MEKDLKEFLLTVLAIGGFMWAIDERTKKMAYAQKLNRKNNDYLNLMSEYLKTQKQIPEEIKNQLINLRREYTGINDAVAMELHTVIDLIQNNKDEIAIEKLASIIENLLKEKYQQEINSSRIPTFHNLLQKAKELNWISTDNYNLSLFVKSKRNQEAHELNTSFTDNEKRIAFLSSIEIIYQLKGIRR